MKKALFFTLASSLLISFGAFAQSWVLTGNNNATTTSILGTTNSVPLRLFTKNAVRITIDTFGFVGINSTHPVSTLDVRGTQFLNGQLKFGLGAHGIQFANPTSTSNKPMMTMFTTGTANPARMVIAHSPAYLNWGLQYDDLPDRFNFLGNGTTTMSIELFTGNVNMNGTVGIGGNANIAGSALVTGDGDFGGVAPPHPYRAYLNHGTYGLGLQNSSSANYWEIYSFNNLSLYQDNSFRGSFDATTGAYTNVSDARLKTNINPMESVLDKINQLKPSSYQFKNVQDQQFYDGFVAQDVMKIFPNLVVHNVDKARNLDVYTMNYGGFGVIAIKGIQELQTQIKQQNETIDNLQIQVQKQQVMIEQMKSVLDKLAPGQFQNVNAGASLQQNSPNPARNATSIGYSLPSNNGSAQLHLIDNLGRTVKTIQLNSSGRINLDLSTLSSGTYTYSLVVDGKIVETKKLVKASE